MVISLIAIGSVLVVGVAFGFVMRGWFNNITKNSENNHKEDDKRSCDNCKFECTNPNEYPCNECADGDIDYWTPSHINKCDTCKHKNKTWFDDPCSHCNGDKWERIK